MIWRGSGLNAASEQVRAMYQTALQSGERYGGGVVKYMVQHFPPYHPPLPLHIKMKVRRTHTHILVRVMTGQKMAQNQESCGGAS